VGQVLMKQATLLPIGASRRKLEQNPFFSMPPEASFF
jgi:hypothetical protein